MTDFGGLDQLFDSKKFDELYSSLQEKAEEKDAEVQWRLARVNKELAEKSNDKKLKEKHMRAGLAAAQGKVLYGLQLDHNNVKRPSQLMETIHFLTNGWEL